MKTHKGRTNHHIGTGDRVEDLDLWPGDVVTVHEGYGYARFIMGPTGALERLPKRERPTLPMPVAVSATVASGAFKLPPMNIKPYPWDAP